MYYYCLYGLKLDSNIPIPWFREIRKCANIDWHIHSQNLPIGKGDYCSCNRAYYISNNLNIGTEKPFLVVNTNSTKQLFHFIYFDGVQFLINNLTSKITFAWPPEETLEYELGYLVATIMSFVLLIRGTFSIHASAFAVNEKCIALAGDSGVGKSTTVAAFANIGYPVVSDDLLALRDDGNNFLAEPAFSGIRLWSKSVEALFGSADALPQIAPYRSDWDKRYLDLRQEGYQFQEEEIPLGAIYLLGSRSSDNSVPRIESVPIQEALLSLIKNNYSAIFLDKNSRAKEMEMFGRILKQVPVRRVVVSNDISQLPQLCEIILADFKQLN